MYTPPHFKANNHPQLIQLIRENSFATLIVNNEISHIPLLLAGEDDNLRLTGHVAKGNPLAKLFDGIHEATAIFHGPHAYISPTWYGNEKSVPTWNYAVVHVHGIPRIQEGENAARNNVTILSDYFEQGMAEPWSIDKAPTDFFESKLKGIIPFEIPIERLEGKLKLGQNHDTAGVIKGLKNTGKHEELRIAEMMMKTDTN